MPNEIGAIVQDAFFVPEDIGIGLAKGIFKRYGSVIRWATGPDKGQIYKHLKPAIPTTEELSLAKAIIAFVSKHKTGFIIAGIITVGTATFAGIKYVINSHKRKKFNKAFSEYINAIEKQSMTLDKIEALEASLEGIKYINFKAEELSSLIILLKNYTIQFTKNNGINNAKIQATGNPIIDLSQYLHSQKEVFIA